MNQNENDSQNATMNFLFDFKFSSWPSLSVSYFVSLKIRF